MTLRALHLVHVQDMDSFLQVALRIYIKEKGEHTLPLGLQTVYVHSDDMELRQVNMDYALSQTMAVGGIEHIP